MVHTTYDASSKESKRLRKVAGKYIARLRKDADLTQRKLADAVGLEYYTFVSQLECGAGRVPPHLYQKFATALEVDSQEFCKQMLRFYDPFTFAGLFGVHPYDELTKEEKNGNGKP